MAKFAVIETGGKQYKVAEGDVLDIEKLTKANPKLAEGGKVVFDKVLLTDDGKSTKVGKPYLEGVTIEATFEGEKKGKKVKGVKFKNKTGYRVKYGHRQTKARVTVAKV